MTPHDHHHEHHKKEHRPLRVGVITASDSRKADNDESGDIIKDALTKAGHSVGFYRIIPDDPDRIRSAVLDNLSDLDAIIITGGTGISPRDNTFEAVHSILDKEIDGFGELFRMLSYNEIGSAAFLSRATAGISSGKIVVSIPGSPAACRLAMEKLLIPQLGHMADLLEL